MYRGSVVAVRPLHTLQARPIAYELSFSCPVGLSGAPVLTRTLPPCVVGYVVQNGRSGMLVAADSESETEPGNRRVIERYEYLTFGLAVATSSVLDIESRMLGGTIREYLRRLSQGGV